MALPGVKGLRCLRVKLKIFWKRFAMGRATCCWGKWKWLLGKLKRLVCNLTNILHALLLTNWSITIAKTFNSRFIYMIHYREKKWLMTGVDWLMIKTATTCWQHITASKHRSQRRKTLNSIPHRRLEQRNWILWKVDLSLHLVVLQASLKKKEKLADWKYTSITICLGPSCSPP